MENYKILTTVYMKSCSNKKCTQINPQPLENFAKAPPSSRAKDRLQYWCNECRWAKGRKYSRDNKEKIVKNNKRWLKENPGKSSEYTMSYYEKNPEIYQGLRYKKYWPELTWKQALNKYNEMFNEQSGKCLICLKHRSEFKRALSVDHCHKTGKIRGLLCDHCNTAIGLLKEDEQIINNALDYLKRKL